MATTNLATTADPAPAARPLLGTAARVLALLQSRPEARSADELAELLGAYKKTVAVALKTLRKRGLVERVGTGSDTRYQIPRAAAGAALSGPRVLLADRPRKLGLRSEWLRLHPPAPEAPDDTEAVAEVAQ